MTNVRNKGFTLIEMVIIMVVLVILVSLAIPSFKDTIRKSRRSDAMDTIMDIHLTQERYRVNHPNYGAASTTVTTQSPGGHYSVELKIPAAGDDPSNVTGYSIVATPLNDQANDSCPDFTLAVDKGAIEKTTGGVADTLCWKK
jgi:type IV pilus assembly protein PilE